MNRVSDDKDMDMLILVNWMTWFNLYLIANNSASVDMTFIT